MFTDFQPQPSTSKTWSEPKKKRRKKKKLHRLDESFPKDETNNKNNQEGENVDEPKYENEGEKTLVNDIKLTLKKVLHIFYKMNFIKLILDCFLQLLCVVLGNQPLHLTE